MRMIATRPGSLDMNKLATVCCFMVALLLVGCGEAAPSDGPGRILSTSEARQLLLQLPYSYTFRAVKRPAGASGAVAGTAVGGHHTVVHFGVALGRHPYGVSVPHAGTSGAYGYSYGGFVYTDDSVVPDRHGHWKTGPQFKTGAQWDEATTMIVKMQEELCKRSTGRPCPP